MKEEDFTGLSKIAKCPICGGELEKGYVIVWKGMYWDVKRHEFRAGKENLAKYPAFTNTNFPALRCRICHVITLDYEQ